MLRSEVSDIGYTQKILVTGLDKSKDVLGEIPKVNLSVLRTCYLQRLDTVFYRCVGTHILYLVVNHNLICDEKLLK